MTKTLGFLTGVCLTAAVFVLVLDGWPHRQPEETLPATVASDNDPLDATPSAVGEVSLHVETPHASATVAGKTDSSIPSASSVAGLIKAATAVTDSSIPPAAAQIPGDTGQPSLSTVSPQADESTTAEPQAVAEQAGSTDSSAPDQARPDDTGDSDATRSHLFWSPFRSEWAARGFAGRLGSATQITIDVVEVGSGRYRAAFDYQDENERLELIERIESITGLQLE